MGQPAGLEWQLVRQGSLALLGQALGMALRLGVQLMLARWRCWRWRWPAPAPTRWPGAG